jgi:hypothetical protein
MGSSYHGVNTVHRIPPSPLKRLRLPSLQYADYSEPNISHKGELQPRLAVLPVYEANGSGAPKIIEVDESSESLKAAAATLPESTRVDVQKDKDRGNGKMMKPKHSFELVDLGLGEGRRGFIMLIQLPEEVRVARSVLFIPTHIFLFHRTGALLTSYHYLFSPAATFQS